MDIDELLKKAGDPNYISGIYNYCDRWCERCQFTSRCLNCTIVEEKAGDFKAIDKVNDDFWKQLFEILGETLAMVKEMAKETGVDIERICEEEATRKEKNSLPDILSHLSKKYVTKVDDWFDANEFSFYEKEDELNRIHLISTAHAPATEALRITDAVEIIRWYQHQIHVKLVRALDSAADEALYDEDGLVKDSDGSAKVALIGIDRSMAAWQILLTKLTVDTNEIAGLIELLENLKGRVETRFPCARSFIRPGFDEDLSED